VKVDGEDSPPLVHGDPPPPVPASAFADDDAAAIRASVADPERFSVLVRRHAPAILRYVTRRIGVESAEDVVAETFLTAFRRRAAYRDDGRDCLPWLYGIATRLVHRHRRTEIKQLDPANSIGDLR
jgi:DNA-directed RNA polymerase specialized sigma24 family protein